MNSLLFADVRDVPLVLTQFCPFYGLLVIFLSLHFALGLAFIWIRREVRKKKVVNKEVGEMRK